MTSIAVNSNIQILSKQNGLRLYSKIVVFSVLCLLFFGALVTSHNAGLSVPDWPTTYGQNMFTFPMSKWQGGIFFEHGHRLLASGVGLLILCLAVWLTITEKRRSVRILGGVTLLGVVTQGALGGLTVLLQLPDSISIAHGMLGQTILLLTISIAFSQSKTFQENIGSLPADRSVFKLACFGIGLLYLQLLLGAMTRHSDSGLAVLDFPTMGGSLIPFATEAMRSQINSARESLTLYPVSMWQIEIHLAHRIGAAVVFLYSIFFLSALQKSEKPLKHKLHRFIGLALIAQLALGVLTVTSLRNPFIASAHVVVGASLLSLYFLAALKSYSWRAKT